MTATDHPRIVVIGVGSTFRGDDAMGHTVIEHLAQDGADRRSVGSGPPLRGAALVESDGEASRLLTQWAGADLAVVVDAMTSGRAPGTVQVFPAGADALPARSVTSSHAAGIAEAWALGRALDTLPDRLLIIGVEAATVAPGDELSPAVAAAIPAVLRLVRAAIASVPDPEPPPPSSTSQLTLQPVRQGASS